MAIERANTATVNTKHYYHAVVIDNDPLIHLLWQLKARELPEKQLKCFTTPQDFFKNQHLIQSDSPLFIDVDLGNNQRGEDVAAQAAQLGFARIFLATGFAKDEVQAGNEVLGVIGKTPLFLD